MTTDSAKTHYAFTGTRWPRLAGVFVLVAVLACRGVEPPTQKHYEAFVLPVVAGGRSALFVRERKTKARRAAANGRCQIGKIAV